MLLYYSQGFPSKRFLVVKKKQANNEINRKILDGGTNPPDGVAIHYYLSEKNLSSLILSVHDDQDKEIATFKPSSGINDNELKEKHITTNLGLNKFIWSMRYSDALQVNYKGAIDHGLQGPIAPPGKYKAKLFKDKQLIECQEFNIIKDPRIGPIQGVQPKPKAAPTTTGKAKLSLYWSVKILISLFIKLKLIIPIN